MFFALCVGEKGKSRTNEQIRTPGSLLLILISKRVRMELNYCKWKLPTQQVTGVQS